MAKRMRSRPTKRLDMSKLRAENRRLKAENSNLRARLESMPAKTVGQNDEESE